MDFQIKPLGKTCAATGQPFMPGEVVHSVLVEKEGQRVRLDYSEQGWDGPPEGTIGQWVCVVPQPDAQRRKPLDADSLLQQFEAMIEEANPAQETFCYVIALLLLQRRRLKLEGSRTDGDIEYLQLSGTHAEGPFEVRDQHLSAEEIAAVQAALNHHLNNIQSHTLQTEPMSEESAADAA